MAFKSTDFKCHFNIFEKILLMKQIKSIEELKQIAEYDDHKGWAEFFITLNGFMRSSKRIVYYPNTKTFDLHNEIDDTYQETLTKEQLRTETLIVEAIGKRLFINMSFKTSLPVPNRKDS